MPLTNKYIALLYFLLFSGKLIEYIFSALSLCSNAYVGPLPRIKISFSLLSILVDELISTPKIITFLRVPTIGCEKYPYLSNPIPYPEHLYLSTSAFFVKQIQQNNHNFVVFNNCLCF